MGRLFGALDGITWDHLDPEPHGPRRETVPFATRSIAETVRRATRIVVGSPRAGRIATSTKIPAPQRRLDIRNVPLVLEVAHHVRKGLPARRSCAAREASERHRAPRTRTPSGRRPRCNVDHEAERAREHGTSPSRFGTLSHEMVEEE